MVFVHNDCCMLFMDYVALLYVLLRCSSVRNAEFMTPAKKKYEDKLFPEFLVLGFWYSIHLMSWSLSLGIKLVRAWSCPLILYITLKFSLFSTRNLCLVHFEIHRPPNMTQYEGHKLNFRFVRSRFSLHCRCWYYSGLWMTLIVRWLKKPPKFRDFIFAKSSMSGMLWKFSALSN